MPEEKQKLLLPDADVYFWPRFLTPAQSNYFLQELSQTINWQQEQIKLFGKEVPVPRLTAWYADAGKSYTYSGIRHEPLPWTVALLELRAAIENITKINFNSVLLNYYRHGQDSMGWHSDDEPELGRNPVIASVSLGQERRFDFRHKTDKTTPKASVWLTHGSLLLMQGPTQHYWQHQISKSAKATQPRINLTFRFIL